LIDFFIFSFLLIFFVFENDNFAIADDLSETKFWNELEKMDRKEKGLT